ncbi:hypothetical protein K458DRAFT_403080 [Lentithecium fluviatile CBS 122367]|uniref:Uncharacterized protein n=1 Tax=Lentithecium fluviatile CBS 122367 TaxID=1168545 RepID=A0A6G1J5C3_9PLEO|nr:hypothetical protein K458DRAFT_403080 [Lentithecium fluviatile CBS 122367]
MPKFSAVNVSQGNNGPLLSLSEVFRALRASGGRWVVHEGVKVAKFLGEDLSVLNPDPLIGILSEALCPLYGLTVILHLLYPKKAMLRNDKGLAVTLSAHIPKRLAINIRIDIRFSPTSRGAEAVPQLRIFTSKHFIFLYKARYFFRQSSNFAF